MKSRWLKDYKESEKAAVKQQIKNAKLVLDRLADLIQEDLDASVREMASRKHFDSNSWEDKMAHYLGEQTALRSIKSLIDIEEK
tara:strand:- start:291 stop:542 length:252 start_codon:yes stop_codon:yes gene_type:complete